MDTLSRRIIEYSYKNKLPHLGSCLTALPIIKHIYDVKKDDEKFVLSCGHAGLALYAVLESKGLLDLDTFQFSVHPDRDGVLFDCSTGSLGQGLPIAVGMALADASKKVYCLISDGECAEGSIWEALAIKEKLCVTNLIVYVNINSFAAYEEVDSLYLINRLRAFCPSIRIAETNFNEYPFLDGLDAHYHVLTDEEFKRSKEEWEKK